MRWSVGRDRFGPVDDVLSGSWSEFCGLLQDATAVPCAALDKDSWWWVAPFLRHPGATRRTNDDVVSMSNWFGADVDTPGWYIDRIRGKLLGLTWCCYTTASSQPDAMRWRVMVLLDREYPAEDHARIWAWFNSKFDNQLCAQTKNVSRIYYMPACWDGELPVFECSYGKPAHVDSILAMVGPIHAHAPRTPYCSTMKRAPNDTPIITDHMLAEVCAMPEGGRIYKVMCMAAKRFRLEGWTLDASDLEMAALEANDTISPGKKRVGLLREAQRALDWADRHFSPQTPLERMRSRVLWERHRFGR